jgi:hypothetical protein
MDNEKATRPGRTPHRLRTLLPFTMNNVQYVDVRKFIIRSNFLCTLYERGAEAAVPKRFFGHIRAAQNERIHSDVTSINNTV